MTENRPEPIPYGERFELRIVLAARSPGKDIILDSYSDWSGSHDLMTKFFKKLERKAKKITPCT